MNEKFKAWMEGDTPPEAPEAPEGPGLRAQLRAAFAAFEPQPGTAEKVEKQFRLYRLFSVLLAAALIGSLLFTVVHLPILGRADNPEENEVVQRYLEEGLAETGATNLVSGMILDYRAFDTFGESCVLFLSACCVILLLRRAPRDEAEVKADAAEILPHPLVLQTVMRFLLPCIFMYGFYVILNGHLSPGGGFSGGTVLGAGLILYASSYGHRAVRRIFSYRTHQICTSVCLLIYAASKAYSFFCGANGIEDHIPKGVPGAIFSGGLILLLNVCVGIIVASTMYSFYVLFRKGEV